MSEGGPLICLEKALVTSWGGIDRLTVTDPSATCDYDRACVTNDYLVMVPLAESMAMTLGAPPADSSFRHLPSGLLAIVQVLYAEPDLDENEKLARLDETIFNAPLYLAEWQISTSPVILFDSAIPGGEFEDERLTFARAATRSARRRSIPIPRRPSSCIVSSPSVSAAPAHFGNVPPCCH